MKKILLPTDFSANAYNAIKYAMQLFQNEKCRFYLLNTYLPVLYDPEYLIYNVSEPTMDQIYRESSEKGLKQVKERIEKDFQNPKHEFKLISSFNTLTEEIKDQVREQQIDFVVMGTKGATGAKEILFGSNTVHAIKRVDCPLLAIPSEFEFKNPECLLFPTDFGIDYTEKQLQSIKEISEAFSAKIKILKIYTGEELTAAQEQNMEKLAELLKNTKYEFFNLENESVTAGINVFQKENDVDILAMINNKHSFFENLLFRHRINEIGFHIKIPFLVIPSEEVVS